VKAYENSVPTIIWQPKPFWSPSDFATTNGWRPKREEYDKPPFVYSGTPQGWTIFLSMVSNQSSQFFKWQPKVFNCQKKGACHMFFENISMTFNKKFPKTYDNPPFVATKTS
jgi:hypothetical protein